MIPIGLALAPPALDVPHALNDLIVGARAAAGSGLASLWLGQLFDIDALTALAVIGGRLRLGIAVSHREFVERRLGYSFDRPARHLREYLQARNPLLHDGAANVRGETVVQTHRGSV
jgi:hypothetical protein